MTASSSSSSSPSALLAEGPVFLCDGNPSHYSILGGVVSYSDPDARVSQSLVREYLDRKFTLLHACAAATSFVFPESGDEDLLMLGQLQ